jgi:thymidylate synthase (FAD)
VSKQQLADPLMQVNLISGIGLTDQQIMWCALHQDYSSEYIWQTIQAGRVPEDKRAGELVVDLLLKGGKGHYGPLEHGPITLACGFMPHSLMQQLRTHRISVSFDCQSFRYTGSQVIDVALGKRDVEEVFYLRPVGFYTDRQGKKYEYKPHHREAHKQKCILAAKDYADDLTTYGLSEEHARDLLPSGYRQHFVVSFNHRSLIHVLDMRWKANAQLEAQWWCDKVAEAVQDIAPAVFDWYLENRAKKAKLAP